MAFVHFRAAFERTCENAAAQYERIRVFDEAGNVIETQEQEGEFKEP